MYRLDLPPLWPRPRPLPCTRTHTLAPAPSHPHPRTYNLALSPHVHRCVPKTTFDMLAAVLNWLAAIIGSLLMLALIAYALRSTRAYLLLARAREAAKRQKVRDGAWHASPLLDAFLRLPHPFNRIAESLTPALPLRAAPRAAHPHPPTTPRCSRRSKERRSSTCLRRSSQQMILSSWGDSSRTRRCATAGCCTTEIPRRVHPALPFLARRTPHAARRTPHPARRTPLPAPCSPHPALRTHHPSLLTPLTAHPSPLTPLTAPACVRAGQFPRAMATSFAAGHSRELPPRVHNFLLSSVDGLDRARPHQHPVQHDGRGAQARRRGVPLELGSRQGLGRLLQHPAGTRPARTRRKNEDPQFFRNQPNQVIKNEAPQFFRSASVIRCLASALLHPRTPHRRAQPHRLSRSAR